MGQHRRVALALLVGGCICGCAGEEPLTLNPMGIRRVPIDTTRPGELAEGNYVAFGLKMPRGLRMEKRSDRGLQAAGRMSVEDLSNYVRERVEGGKVETGPNRTRFYDVTILGSPGKSVDVDVLRIFQGARIVVTNKTRKRAPREPELTEKERWGRMGLTPDGKVIDKYQQ